MYTIKVLKRKDASSVIVAVVIATIIGPLLASLVGNLAGWISGLARGQYVSTTISVAGAGWQADYLYPFVVAILELIALEILVFLYVMIHEAVTKK